MPGRRHLPTDMQCPSQSLSKRAGEHSCQLACTSFFPSLSLKFLIFMREMVQLMSLRSCPTLTPKHRGAQEISLESSVRRETNIAVLILVRLFSVLVLCLMETHTRSSGDLVFVQRARQAPQCRKPLLPELIVTQHCSPASAQCCLLRAGHVPSRNGE